MAKQRVCVVLVDHGGDTEITLFERWADARQWFDHEVAQYGDESDVSFEISRSSARLVAQNMGTTSYPFIECRKQVVERG